MPLDNVQNEMERTPYVAESLRVRCPSCRKLYLVQFSDIQEAKPRFECVQCRTRFWISLTDMDLAGEIIGLPVQMREVPVTQRVTKIAPRNLEPCPKCFKPIPVGSDECNHCGIVVEKVRNEGLGITETYPARSMALDALWKKIVDDYGNEELHADFIRQADRERSLPFAAAQYAQMQKLMPTDEITKRKLREIQALAGEMLGPSAEKRARRRFARVWQIPLFGAALMIVAGLFIPYFRNLVGVGAAFLFLAVALQFQFGRRT